MQISQFEKTAQDSATPEHPSQQLGLLSLDRAWAGLVIDQHQHIGCLSSLDSLGRTTDNNCAAPYGACVPGWFALPYLRDSMRNRGATRRTQKTMATEKSILAAPGIENSPQRI